MSGPPDLSSAPSAPVSNSTSQALRERHGEHYRWRLLVAVMVGTIASIMSSTVVNVAIPALAHQFHLAQSMAQWVSSGFMVASTVTMLTTPWLLARFGYRATYVGCMVVLMAGGILGGVAQSFPLVLAARVIEGLAAGVLQPIPAIIIMRAFQPHEQGRAISLFTVGVILAPAVGPSVGGLLVDWFGWRSIFFMVIPFCVASIWLARVYVPTSAPGGVAASSDERLDWGGLVLGTVGTLALLDGLVSLREGPPQRAWGLLALAVVCGIAFVGWERRRARRGQAPLMDLRLFAWRPFAMGALVALSYGTALFGSTYLLPVYMQMALGLSASSVGAVMLPAGLVLAGAIALVGRWADTTPASWLVNMGLALLALSFTLMVTIGLQSGLWLLIAFTIIGRIGLGFILPSLNLGAMRGLDRSLLTQGPSAINFIRMLADNAHPAARLAAFDDVFVMLAALCALAMLAARGLGSHSRLPPTR